MNAWVISYINIGLVFFTSLYVSGVIEDSHRYPKHVILGGTLIASAVWPLYLISVLYRKLSK